MALLLWQKQETLFIEKKKKKKQEKKRYYGVKCHSVEMPHLLFSEEAVQSLTENFLTVFIYCCKKKKRRFFIAALICELIIFSYKNPALVPCIHPVSYHDSLGEVQGDLQVSFLSMKGAAMYTCAHTTGNQQ